MANRPRRTAPKPDTDGDPVEMHEVPAEVKPTSGQLRAAAAAAAKAAESSKVARPAAPKPRDTRPVTAVQWGRGKPDPLLTAFVAEHSRGRVVKHIPAEWMGLYRDWLKKPRG